MDLPSHGDSPSMGGYIAMNTIADHVYSTLQNNNLVVDTILGHSFGGKVALELMRFHNQHLPNLPKTALILDISIPIFIHIIYGKKFLHFALDGRDNRG